MRPPSLPFVVETPYAVDERAPELLVSRFRWNTRGELHLIHGEQDTADRAVRPERRGDDSAKRQRLDPRVRDAKEFHGHRDVDGGGCAGGHYGKRLPCLAR